MNNNFDYKTFEENLYTATEIVIRALIQKYGAENIRAFCLYSDEDAGSAVFCFDTYQNLQEKLATEDESEHDYYRWYFGEWLMDDALSEDLNQISKMLFGADYGDDFAGHKDKIYNTFVAVLNRLKNEECFKNFRSDFILMFGVSDFYDKEKELNWMEQLNEKPVFESFRAYREMY